MKRVCWKDRSTGFVSKEEPIHESTVEAQINSCKKLRPDIKFWMEDAEDEP